MSTTGLKIIALLITAVSLGVAAVDSLCEAASTLYLNGTVAAVRDGDSILVKPDDGKKTIVVRLYGVDAPEAPDEGRPNGQPYFKEAAAFTSAFALKKAVSIRVKETDKYDRVVGEVFVDGRSLNRELVREGLAWWNNFHEPLDMDIKRLETEARLRRAGLWKDPKPTPPWEHRRAADAGR